MGVTWMPVWPSGRVSGIKRSPVLDRARTARVMPCRSRRDWKKFHLGVDGRGAHRRGEPRDLQCHGDAACDTVAETATVRNATVVVPPARTANAFFRYTSIQDGVVRVSDDSRNNALLPARRFTRETSRPRRLGLHDGFRLWLSRGLLDFLLEFVIAGQASELVREHHGLLRGDLEPLSAGCACHFVLQAQKIVSHLGELDPVLFACSRRQPGLLRAPRPSDAVVAGSSTPRALVTPQTRFGTFVKQVALINGHGA